MNCYRSAEQAVKPIQNLSYVYHIKDVQEMQLAIRKYLGEGIVRYTITYKRATAKKCNATPHREWEQECLFSMIRNVERNTACGSANHTSRGGSNTSAHFQLLYISCFSPEHKLWNMLVLTDRFYRLLTPGTWPAYILRVLAMVWLASSSMVP